MASDFLDAFAARANLTAVEHKVLADSDVRSAADVYSLVKSFPSIGQRGVRVDALTQAAAQEVSPDFAAAATQPLQAFAIAASPTGVTPAFGTHVAAAAMPAAPSGPMANSIDLRLAGWGIKDQGGRDACVAFATAACAEHLRAGGGNAPNLSEQFLYWAIKDHGDDPDRTHESSRLAYARTSLANDGICPEDLCQYSDAAFHPVSGPKPGSGAVQAAANNRIAATTYTFSPVDQAKTIYDLLSARRPVAVSMFRFHDPAAPQREDNWTTHTAQSYGRVLFPPEQALLRGSHSVCVTGYRPDPGAPGGGYFVFRNSWGPGWGTWPGQPNSYAPERGYGDMSVKYVNFACWEILQL